MPEVANPVENFLSAYFQVHNRNQQQQNFNSEMAFKQSQLAQQGDFENRRLEIEKQRAQAEDLFRQSELKNQQITQMREDAAERARQFEAASTGLTTGKLKPAGVTTAPSVGYGQIPVLEKGSYQLGGQNVRAATPEEYATEGQRVTAKVAQQDRESKYESLSQFWQKNPKFKPSPEERASLEAHVLYGFPIPQEHNQNIQDGLTKAVGQQINLLHDKDATPEQKAEANERVRTLGYWGKTLNEASAGVRVGFERETTNRLANDQAALQLRVAGKLANNKSPSAADRNNAVQAATAEINQERTIAGQPALHPKAAEGVMVTEEKGISSKPDKNSAINDILKGVFSQGQAAPVAPVNGPPQQ